MKVTVWDFVASGIAMALILLGAFMLVSRLAEWFTIPYFLEYHVIADALLFLLAYGIISALAVRLILRIRPFEFGEFDMDHPNFFFWKLRIMIDEFGRYAMRPFSFIPLLPVIAALFGAKIGNGATLGAGSFLEDPPSVCIGKRAVLGHDACIFGSMITPKGILFGRVIVGDGASIGAGSMIMPDVEIGENASIGIGSVLLPGTRVPAGESWRGNPARKWM